MDDGQWYIARPPVEHIREAENMYMLARIEHDQGKEEYAAASRLLVVPYVLEVLDVVMLLMEKYISASGASNFKERVQHSMLNITSIIQDRSADSETL